ncbi:MAG: M16 family metallopeptidase [Armatimonadota bacterium]
MIKKETLPNGVRIITESVPHVQSVAIGIWTDAGARDERESEKGISHFIEHMLFKGTEKRTAQQIADEFDSIGGQLNAFTEKEYTCYYGKVLSEHLPVAVDVLSDMFLHSVLDPREIELEKNVVLEEIKRHEDTPDDLVHDLFIETVWAGHPLGSPVLGNTATVGAISREEMAGYLRSLYTPDSVVITAAGNLAHEDLVEMVQARFGDLGGSKRKSKGIAPNFLGTSKFSGKSTEQVHLCIGTRGYSQDASDKYSLAVIDATLGGGMSSRLFQEIREKRGLAYSIGSYSASYREGGFFTVYGGTSRENVEQVAALVRAEFASVRSHNITAEELSRAKNQIRGGIILSLEGMTSRMIRMAKSELYFGRVVPLEEIVSLVMKVTHEDIERVAQHMFGVPEFPMVAVGPYEDKVVCA